MRIPNYRGAKVLFYNSVAVVYMFQIIHIWNQMKNELYMSAESWSKVAICRQITDI